MILYQMDNKNGMIRMDRIMIAIDMNHIKLVGFPYYNN